MLFFFSANESYPLFIYFIFHFNKKLREGGEMRAAVIPTLSCLEFLHFKLLFRYLYNNSNWSFLAFLFNSKIPFFSLAHRIKTPSHFVFSLLLLHMVLTTFCQLFFCILFPICSFLSISSTKNSASQDCYFNKSIQL